MEKLLFVFTLNGTEYKVLEADCINDEKDIMGYTVFTESIVYIKKMSESQTLRTLKHELAHVWLYEYGHNQHDEDKSFNNEDVCEIVACSNDWINEMVKKYQNIKKNA